MIRVEDSGFKHFILENAYFFDVLIFIGQY